MRHSQNLPILLSRVAALVALPVAFGLAIYRARLDDFSLEFDAYDLNSDLLGRSDD